MKNAHEILNFNFSPAVLQQSGKNIVPITMVHLNEFRINKLLKIIEEVGETDFKFKGNALIPLVFKKFKSNYRNRQQYLEVFDNRELRTLTYSLSHAEFNLSPIFSDANELDFLFEILEVRWKDSFLIGLINCYFKNWESEHKKCIEKISAYIFEKLKQYDGSRKVLVSFKTNMKFFDKANGDVCLGSELAINNKHLIDATNYISLPRSWFSYSYFSKVISAYYEKRKNELPQFLHELDKSLTEHNNSVSNKRIVSELIIQANTSDFAMLQDKVKAIAFRLIGDPGNMSNWTTFKNATDYEKERLKNARNILNEWITRQFINVFFEKCINDSRRKNFWLKYAKEIVQFRIVGSNYIKQLLISDTRISGYVTPRFSSINSTGDRNSALMFIMKNHLFIEFSDNGAFYAYKLSNISAPSIETTTFSSTRILKRPSMDLLIYRNGRSLKKKSDEGRLCHQDGEVRWEQAAEFWLNNVGGINV